MGNPLFPVNYVDRMIRMMSADHARETMKFARNANNLMERLWLRLFSLNYRRPHRENAPKEKRKTAGEVSGLERERIENELSTLFERRRFLSFSAFHPWLDMRTWLRCWVTPLRKLAEPLPRYAYH